MPRPLLALVTLAMFWPELAGAAGGPTFADTQKQPAPKLAQGLLSPFANQLVAVRRSSGDAFTPDTDQTIAFSTRPKSAGFPGLCAARLVQVRLRYDKASPKPGDRGQVQDLSVRDVYGVVGATDPLPNVWYGEYAKWLDTSCAGLGDGLNFFSASNPASAWRAMRIIAQLSLGADGKAAAKDQVACAPSEAPCDVLALLAGLKPSALADVEEQPCNALEPSGQSCLGLTFITLAAPDQERRTHLMAILARPQPYPVELVRAQISTGSSISD